MRRKPGKLKEWRKTTREMHTTFASHKKHVQVAARALATYLIPGCVGRGVRLGSESLFGSGVWKSGTLCFKNKNYLEHTCTQSQTGGGCVGARAPVVVGWGG